MKKSVFAILPAFLLASLSAIGFAAQAVTNKDIVSMIKAGLSSTVILQTIQTSPGQYDTSPQALIALKASNVPDTVITAMLSKSTGASQPTAASNPASLIPSGYMQEVDLYNSSGKQMLLQMSTPIPDSNATSTKNALMKGTLFTMPFAKTRISTVVAGKNSDAIVKDGNVYVIVKGVPPSMTSQIEIVEMNVNKNGDRVISEAHARALGLPNQRKMKENRVTATMSCNNAECKLKPPEPLAAGHYGVKTGPAIYTFDVSPTVAEPNP